MVSNAAIKAFNKFNPLSDAEDDFERYDDIDDDHSFQPKTVGNFLVKKAIDLDNVESSSDDDDGWTSARRSPMKSLVARRTQAQAKARRDIQHNVQEHAQDEPDVPKGKTTDLCGRAYEVLDAPAGKAPDYGFEEAPALPSSQMALENEAALSSVTGIAASNVKRGPPKTPSPPP
ncbi:hypothetical protein EDD11_008263 [Mortierella claussenii]|nr:hypothetical protein EDD11_008263 [Mortierella claussenii]